MDGEQSHELLTAGLSSLPSGLVADAVQATGRWPVLLSLVHGAVQDAVRVGADAAEELADVLEVLKRDGITALDATNPGERSAAVAAKVGVSLRRLTPDERAVTGSWRCSPRTSRSPARSLPGSGHTPVAGRRFRPGGCAGGCSATCRSVSALRSPCICCCASTWR